MTEVLYKPEEKRAAGVVLWSAGRTNNGRHCGAIAKIAATGFVIYLTLFLLGLGLSHYLMGKRAIFRQGTGSMDWRDTDRCAASIRGICRAGDQLVMANPDSCGRRNFGFGRNIFRF